MSFEEAATVFGDPLSLTISDPSHFAPDEERLITIGQSNEKRTVVVVHLDLGEMIRIISERLATPRERNAYEDGK